MTKICSKCKEGKSFSVYPPKKNGKFGLNSWCRVCINKYNKERRSKNPELHREVDRKSYKKHAGKRKQKSRGFRFVQKYWPHLSYKQALAEWDRMYTEQGGLCSICEEKKPLDVEHDHDTLVVRSLACNDCNTALARIKENLSYAKGLVCYIVKWKT